MLVANVHQDAEEFRRRIYKAAFAENWFSDYCGHVFGGHHALKCVLEMTRAVDIARWIFERIRTAIAISVRNAVNVGRKWREARLVRMRFAGQGQRHHGASMEASSNAIMPGRPVWARAILTAFSTASAPVFTNSVFFGNFPGVMRFSRSASRM